MVEGKGEVTNTAFRWYFSVYMLGSIWADFLIHRFPGPLAKRLSSNIVMCLLQRQMSELVALAGRLGQECETQRLIFRLLSSVASGGGSSSK